MIMSNKYSVNSIKIDLSNSKGSFVRNLNDGKDYLDFMGMYSTLAIGYNNEDLMDRFTNNFESINLLSNKITNCEFDSIAKETFSEVFKNELGKDFESFYFTSTGALAVEAAIKTAFVSKLNPKGKILRFSGSYHGIYGIAGMLTDRFESVERRMKFFSKIDWPILNPYYDDRSSHLNLQSYDMAVEELHAMVKQYKDELSGILVEPVQCTFGDHYIDKNYIKEIRSLCSSYNIPLIFDEIQTGFYTSGEKWYYQKLNIQPDILIFGKKAQLSGIMVKSGFDKIFNEGKILEATWDSCIIDMQRSHYIINILKEKGDTLDKINNQGFDFISKIQNLKYFKNIRHSGYLIALDCKDTDQRNMFIKRVRENRLLLNPTGEKSIRVRPHLLTSAATFDLAYKIISDSI